MESTLVDLSVLKYFWFSLFSANPLAAQVTCKGSGTKEFKRLKDLERNERYGDIKIKSGRSEIYHK